MKNKIYNRIRILCSSSNSTNSLFITYDTKFSGPPTLSSNTTFGGTHTHPRAQLCIYSNACSFHKYAWRVILIIYHKIYIYNCKKYDLHCVICHILVQENKIEIQIVFSAQYKRIMTDIGR